MAERGDPLSERELDVLHRLAAGESNKAIANGLSISPLTVKTHRETSTPSWASRRVRRR
jgi:DNA-binding CsgD family transcriptional regulator